MITASGAGAAFIAVPPRRLKPTKPPSSPNTRPPPVTLSTASPRSPRVDPASTIETLLLASTTAPPKSHSLLDIGESHSLTRGLSYDGLHGENTNASSPNSSSPSTSSCTPEGGRPQRRKSTSTSPSSSRSPTDESRAQKTSQRPKPTHSSACPPGSFAGTSGSAASSSLRLGLLFRPLAD